MVGASYQSRTYMTQLSKYKGLFAEGGDLDIPSTATAGIAFRVTPRFLVGFDYQFIHYNEVRSMANSFPKIGLASLNGQAPQNKLGANDGMGFGWEDMNVFKIGAEWSYNDKLTIRVGVSHNTQTFDESEVLFNILAPGVVKDHVTIGATYNFSENLSLNFSYAHAVMDDITGTDLGGNLGGQVLQLEMSQHEAALGITYKW